MLSKLIAWFLAAITALMNNFGFWQQPEVTYKGDPGYVIEEDVVNYREVQQWYVEGFQGENMCTVAAQHHDMQANTWGSVMIVAGAEMNPDAQLVFSDEDVIIVPSRGQVMSQPSTSSDKIVVQGTESGAHAYKMIINKPKRWFCCEKVNPTVTGSFRHQQEDHRIILGQADTVCVASSDTTVELFVGDPGTGELKKATLREFLHVSDQDANIKSDPNKILNGSTEQVKTVMPDKENLRSMVDIADERIFTGPSGWHQAADGVRWWWGKMPEPGKDYPADQYIIYEGYYYYFDSEGYMVTGWGDDGYYYWEDPDAYGKGESSFKQGALCFDTMVPHPDIADAYLYVDLAGKIDMDVPEKSMSAAGTAYAYNEAGYYGKTAGHGINSGGNGSGSGDNNSGGPNIDNQGGTYPTLTNEQWKLFTEEHEALDESMNGWYTYGDEWVHLTEGERTEPAGYYDADVSGRDAYICEIGGMLYWFYEDNNVMVKGNRSGEAPIYGHVVVGGRDEWMILKETQGVYKNEWYETDDGKWLHAGGDYDLASPYYVIRGTTQSYEVHQFASDEEKAAGVNSRWYAFDSSGYLDTTTPVVTGIAGSALGQLQFELDDVNVAGSRRMK